MPARDRIVLVGASAGGLAAIQALLAELPADFPWPLAVVQHVGQADDIGAWSELFAARCRLSVEEARGGAAPRAGVVHLAPAGYHLLIERNRRFALSADAKVLHVRPSIDALFQSGADAYGAGAVGVVLTGANDDGARGLADIVSRGGIALVQDPETAEAPQMPRAALAYVAAATVLPPAGLGAHLRGLAAKASP